MHDEDSANGLWVSNSFGETWAAYGDRQLWSGKAATNRLQVVKAAQTGVDEVWQAFLTGNLLEASDFAALKMVNVA